MGIRPFRTRAGDTRELYMWGIEIGGMNLTDYYLYFKFTKTVSSRCARRQTISSKFQDFPIPGCRLAVAFRRLVDLQFRKTCPERMDDFPKGRSIRSLDDLRNGRDARHKKYGPNSLSVYLLSPFTLLGNFFPLYHRSS